MTEEQCIKVLSKFWCMKTYIGVRVKYAITVNGKRKYSTKTLKFENGIPEAIKGEHFDIDYCKLDKWILAKLPERIKLLGYKFLTMK